jgi:hypothetical protein
MTKGGRQTIRAPKISSLRKDNYITYGFTTTGLGTASGVLGTGSLAMNDYLLNSSTAITQGSGINNRTGNKLYFTNLYVRTYVGLGAAGRVRVIIGKTVDPNMAKQSSNTLLTAVIEGTTVLEPPAAQNGSMTAIDYPIANANDVKILHDKIYVNNTGQTTEVPIEFNTALRLQRGYDTSGNVVEGSWFVYFVASATTNVTGLFKLSYADQMAT